MIVVENKSNQGMAIVAKIDANTSIPLKFSRGIAVQSYQAAVEAWTNAKPEERISLNLIDPKHMIDPYTGAVPVAVVKLDDLAKEHKVEPAALLASLRKSAFFRACEADGRLVVTGDKKG